VKYLILTAALIAMSVSVMALPSGKPFIELEGMRYFRRTGRSIANCTN